MNRDDADHALERLVFFSDAVFAIVITLLVLEIRIPELGAQSTERQWLNALIDLLPHFGAFMLSFLVIGALWISHHNLFVMLKHYDAKLLWPNLVLLLTVAFLPFTTSLLTTGSLASAPFAFYAASLLAAGLAKARLVGIALSRGNIKAGVTASQVKGELRRRWIMPFAALVTVVLAFVLTPWNTVAMLLLPMLKRFKAFRDPA